MQGWVVGNEIKHCLSLSRGDQREGFAEKGLRVMEIRLDEGFRGSGSEREARGVDQW